jgi:hypothetical protein
MSAPRPLPLWRQRHTSMSNKRFDLLAAALDYARHVDKCLGQGKDAVIFENAVAEAAVAYSESVRRNVSNAKKKKTT